MTAPIATITAARLVGTAISPSHFGEINRLHTDPQVMGLPVILLDGRSQTSPLAMPVLWRTKRIGIISGR